jgi:hypothetical protein
MNSSFVTVHNHTSIYFDGSISLCSSLGNDLLTVLAIIIENSCPWAVAATDFTLSVWVSNNQQRWFSNPKGRFIRVRQRSSADFFRIVHTSSEAVSLYGHWSDLVSDLFKTFFGIDLAITHVLGSTLASVRFCDPCDASLSTPGIHLYLTVVSGLAHRALTWLMVHRIGFVAYEKWDEVDALAIAQMTVFQKRGG